MTKKESLNLRTYEPFSRFYCQPQTANFTKMASGFLATGYRLDRFLKVLRSLRFLDYDVHPLSSIVPSISGLRPAPEGLHFFRYTNTVRFPLGMPLLVLRTTFPPKGGTEPIVSLTFYPNSRCYMNFASHLQYSLHIAHYSLLFRGAL